MSDMKAAMTEYQEFDVAGNIVNSYLVSGTEREKRIDVVSFETVGPLWKKLIRLDTFLPAGYPHSVTDDYLRYQVFDSLQAFTSSIAGLIASRAVLEGVGVGDASASPTAALLLSIFQDSMARVATILFAHRFSVALEPECKMYRLAADVFNDAAMILDCLSPGFPKPFRVLILAGSSMLRAICGVAAGSSKASLSAHFARWGNLAELNAKDASQETVISLFGMLAGSLVVSRVTSFVATWSTLLLLLGIHLSMNLAAVRSVQMRSLNRQRVNVVMSHYIDTGVILTPAEVADSERIFERDGVLRWRSGDILGWARLGVSLKTLLQAMDYSRTSHTGAFQETTASFDMLFDLFRQYKHLLWYSARTSTLEIVMKRESSARDQLFAWTHALLLMRQLKDEKQEVCQDQIVQSLTQTQIVLDRASQLLENAGYDLDVAALETRLGSRLQG